ncbi:MAG: hypothetical protein Q8862_00340 [Bacteroidota bacterium]|nr:hypothetical protein [Bacteroidota bacterium]MDP4204508.1 hypothetical protein [Bacteroidota bacterium]
MKKIVLVLWSVLICLQTMAQPTGPDPSGGEPVGHPVPAGKGMILLAILAVVLVNRYLIKHPKK